MKTKAEKHFFFLRRVFEKREKERMEIQPLGYYFDFDTWLPIIVIVNIIIITSHQLCYQHLFSFPHFFVAVSIWLALNHNIVADLLDLCVCVWFCWWFFFSLSGAPLFKIINNLQIIIETEGKKFLPERKVSEGFYFNAPSTDIFSQ